MRQLSHQLPLPPARPALKGTPSPALKEVRDFFEDRAAHWDGPKSKPRSGRGGGGDSVVPGDERRADDGQAAPVDAKALDRMWTLQQRDGAWNWIKCNWPPFEFDDYYGRRAGGGGRGRGPGRLRSVRGSAGRPGKAAQLTLRQAPAPNVHHETMLLWASVRLDGLMSTAEREATVKKLLALRRPDGGWNLPSLGNYKRHDKTANPKDGPSDGYGTGLVMYVLRQAGVPAQDERLQRGVAWLKANQRESGGWFTRSLSNDRHHFIMHTGSAFAVLALRLRGVRGAWKNVLAVYCDRQPVLGWRAGSVSDRRATRPGPPPVANQ